MDVTLLLALKQDLSALERLVEEVARHLQVDFAQTWLRPGRPSSSYLGCLELTLDLIYLLVHLFLHQGRGPVEKRTLGLCMRLLWNRLQKAPLVDGEAPARPLGMVTSDKASQSELTSLSSCDSCGSAISCVKRLLSALDLHNHESRCAIYDVTQFGSMLKVTSSIEEALRRLLLQLFELQEAKDGLHAANLKQDARNRLLEEKATALQCKLRDESQRALLARLELERFTASHAQATGRLRLAVQALPKPRPLVQIHQECALIEQIMHDHEATVARLNAKLSKLNKHASKLEVRVVGCCESSRDASAHYASMVRKWVALKERLRPKHGGGAISGNPVEDIQRAIEENKAQIAALEEENDRLARLLGRFRQKHDSSLV